MAIFELASRGLPVPKPLHLAHSLLKPSACGADLEGNPVWATKTTGERTKASFSKRLNNLAGKRAEFDNIMRDGTINASNRKKIKNYTASIARLAKESRHSHYVLTESEKETLASLQTYANKLNRYLSQVQ